MRDIYFSTILKSVSEFEYNNVLFMNVPLFSVCVVEYSVKHDFHSQLSPIADAIFR